MNIKTKLLSITLASISLTSMAYAMGNGGYMGIQLGETNTHNVPKNVYIQTTNITTGVINLDQSGPVLARSSNTGFGTRLFFGYNFNEYTAIEGGFIHYGPSTYKPYPNSFASASSCNTENVTGNFITPCNNPTIRENGFDFEGKGVWPLFAGIGVLGKAGISIMTVSSGGSMVTNNTSTNGSGTTMTVRPLLGIGASYDFTQSLQVDLTMTRVFKGGAMQNADFVALGLSYHFTDAQCGQFLC